MKRSCRQGEKEDKVGCNPKRGESGFKVRAGKGVKEETVRREVSKAGKTWCRHVRAGDVRRQANAP